MNSRDRSEFEGDAGSPLPNFDASGIKLTTIAPALGVPNLGSQPDYLEYDAKGRGIITVMFANTGLAYFMGVFGGGAYGFKEGLVNTPSNRFRVQVNSVLNHCSRHGSRAGNLLGVLSIMYTLYEGAADHFEIDQYTGPLQPAGPAFAALMTGITYKSQAGPRVAGLAGFIGLGAVGATYAGYTLMGIPYGSRGWLFF